MSARALLALSRRLAGRAEAALGVLEGRAGKSGETFTRDAASWYEGLTGRRLDPWQRDVLASPAQRILLLCSRQVGKTEVVAAYAAHGALHRGRRVGILSPTLRQSLVVFRRVRRLLVLAEARLLRDSVGALDLPHGGHVVAFPGDDPDRAVRGETLEDLVVDEAALVRDEVLVAAAPTLATVADHREIHLGTPKGQKGTFWKEWTSGDGWERFSVTAAECPRISPQFLARMRARLGPLYEQEFCNKFLVAPGGVLDSDRLDAIFGDDVAPDAWSHAPETEGVAPAW